MVKNPLPVSDSPFLTGLVRLISNTRHVKSELLKSIPVLSSTQKICALQQIRSLSPYYVYIYNPQVPELTYSECFGPRPHSLDNLLRKVLSFLSLITHLIS